MRRLNTSEILIISIIFNRYYTFSNDLSNLIAGGNKKQIARNLEKLIYGFQPITNQKTKDFYRKYKVILETILEFTDISTFICNNYGEDGLSEDSNLDYIYNFINSNKDKMDQIFSLLSNIYNLGFDTINYDEKMDFSKSTYFIDSNYDYNGEMVFLDNMELVPGYPLEKIEYKTNKSNYKIVVKKLCFGKMIYEKSIYLNSMLFDRTRLPNNLDKKAIFDPIVKLREDKQDLLNKLKKSVELGVALDDFNDSFTYVNSLIDSIEDENAKEEFKLKLIEIKNILTDLNTISNNDNLNNNPSVSTETIKDEVKKFKKRRNILTKI